jgi:hypothetical protein
MNFAEKIQKPSKLYSRLCDCNLVAAWDFAERNHFTSRILLVAKFDHFMLRALSAVISDIVNF